MYRVNTDFLVSNLKPCEREIPPTTIYVLVLNAVAAMSQLSETEQATPNILAAIDFNPGHRCADFNPKSDKVANMG
jgi:hypothetical protein